MTDFKSEQKVDHSVETLVKTSMQSLREMMDVNIVIGDIINTPAGVSVIPVSKVVCGFAAGGGEVERKREQPYWGGSGAGLKVQPVCFLVINGEHVRMIPISGATNLDKAIEAVPVVVEQLISLFEKNKEGSSNRPII